MTLLEKFGEQTFANPHRPCVLVLIDNAYSHLFVNINLSSITYGLLHYPSEYVKIYATIDINHCRQVVVAYFDFNKAF